MKDLQIVGVSAKLSTDGMKKKKTPQNSCWSIRQPAEELHSLYKLVLLEILTNGHILVVTIV